MDFSNVSAVARANLGSLTFTSSLTTGMSKRMVAFRTSPNAASASGHQKGLPGESIILQPVSGNNTVTGSML
jgi:hypothetical protein